jgi:hypothetical protein
MSAICGKKTSRELSLSLVERPIDDEKVGPGGCLAALAVGPLVAFGTAALWSHFTGRFLDFDEEWAVLAIQALLVSMPFVGVALTGTKRAAPWIVGLGLTLLLWGYYLFRTVSHQRHPDQVGADIGLGLAMLFSPVVITAGSIGVHLWQRRRDD